jgi:5-(carboxyamino)imidazole ribonucleotide synthase
MLALEARRMGYRVHVFSPDVASPTGQVADVETTAEYGDLAAVRQFAQQVDVITYEFENVPLDTAVAAHQITPVRPGPQALAVAQNRQREKQFMRDNNLPVAPFVPVQSLADLEAGLAQIGVPAVLKTAESGYDGKGQVKINQLQEAAAAWQTIGQKPAVLEGWVNFVQEVSVVGARDVYGDFAAYGLIQNDHANHILDISRSPRRSTRPWPTVPSPWLTLSCNNWT